MQHTPIPLNASIQLIIINLHGKTLPPYAFRHARRLSDKRSSGPVVGDDGKTTGTGVLKAEAPDRNTSIDGLVEAIKEAGFYPVSVGRRETYNTDNDSVHKTMRYTFGRIPQDDVTVRELVEDMVDELDEDFAAQSLWNVLVHLNPFYTEGKPTEGKHLVSIDINGRVPLLRADGSPEMRRLKGADKQPVGDVRYPLRPTYYLGIANEKLTLLVNEEEERAVAERARLVAEHEASVAQVASAG